MEPKVIEYIEATTGEVVAWWCGTCKKRLAREDTFPSVFEKSSEEHARRLRSQRRKMKAEDRERDRVLGVDRAKLDNKFLTDCGIEAVTFHKGRIVPWKGLLCGENERHRRHGEVLREA